MLVNLVHVLSKIVIQVDLMAQLEAVFAGGVLVITANVLSKIVIPKVQLPILKLVFTKIVTLQQMVIIQSL
jgi:hypothetical protein